MAFHVIYISKNPPKRQNRKTSFYLFQTHRRRIRKKKKKQKQMAMVIRRSSFSLRPTTPPPAPPSSSGKIVSLPLKGEMFESALRYTLRRKFESYCLLGSGKLLSLQYDMAMKQFVSSSGMMVKRKIESYLPKKRKIESSAMALLASNALIFTTPFQALAETCEADNSFFNMPLLLLVALIGATVGGLLARQRRGELQRLNEQLRQINTALRRQAKIESYAPTLSYAPVGSRVQEEVIVDPRKEELISRLKIGKNFLRNQDPEKAFAEFKAGLDLAQALKDPIEEKKAARGLGASLQRQGKYRDAIKYHSLVLQISGRVGEESGNTEAYGAIADCYTELGDLEKAGKFYDKYIARLESD